MRGANPAVKRNYTVKFCLAYTNGLSTPFRKWEGVRPPDLPHTEEERDFAREDVTACCWEIIYKTIPPGDAARGKEDGVVISSDLKVCQERPEGSTERFVVNLSRPSEN